MRSPPVGTARRIRLRALSAVIFLAASAPPGVVATGLAAGGEAYGKGALAVAVGLWGFGLGFALWAAFPTVRYWEVLPGAVRWLGALPLLAITLFVITTVFTVL